VGDHVMAHQYGGLKFEEIVDGVELNRTGSILTTIKKLMVVLEEDRNLLRKFNWINS
jgi:hypothetical protein